jgi:hypothetical protein
LETCEAQGEEGKRGDDRRSGGDIERWGGGDGDRGLKRGKESVGDEWVEWGNVERRRKNRRKKTLTKEKNEKEK